jgi:hypothetical protein
VLLPNWYAAAGSFTRYIRSQHDREHFRGERTRRAYIDPHSSAFRPIEINRSSAFRPIDINDAFWIFPTADGATSAARLLYAVQRQRTHNPGGRGANVMFHQSSPLVRGNAAPVHDSP